MIIVDSVLGNINDPEWAARLAAVEVDVLQLDQWEAQKSRFRKNTAMGTELAVSLSRDTHLRDGDVMLWDPQTPSAVVVRIAMREVMILHLEELMRIAPEEAMRTCIELGHAMGNQHWPALVKGSVVYVPLTVDRKVMASVMKTHAFEHIRYEFTPGTEVISYLTPHESRRLFGGAEGQVHSHAHASTATPQDANGHDPDLAHALTHTHSHSDPHEHRQPAPTSRPHHEH